MDRLRAQKEERDASRNARMEEAREQREAERLAKAARREVPPALPSRALVTPALPSRALWRARFEPTIAHGRLASAVSTQHETACRPPFTGGAAARPGRAPGGEADQGGHAAVDAR